MCQCEIEKHHPISVYIYIFELLSSVRLFRRTAVAADADAPSFEKKKTAAAATAVVTGKSFIIHTYIIDVVVV